MISVVIYISSHLDHGKNGISSSSGHRKESITNYMNVYIYIYINLIKHGYD